MSRLNKYKAWDRGCMLGPQGLLMADAPEWLENLTSEAVLLQFTGLIDVNGREVYEGDLVKKHGQDSPIYQVVWSENAVGFALELEGPPHNNEWPGFLELEVVGNIWENGELINEPK